MSKMRTDINRRLAKIEGDLIKQGKNISKASQASFSQMSGDKTESKLVSYEDRIKELETFKISTDLTLQGLDQGIRESQFMLDAHELQIQELKQRILEDKSTDDKNLLINLNRIQQEKANNTLMMTKQILQKQQIIEGDNTISLRIGSSEQQREIIDRLSKLQMKVEDLERLNLQASIESVKGVLASKIDRDEMEHLEKNLFSLIDYKFSRLGDVYAIKSQVDVAMQTISKKFKFLTELLQSTGALKQLDDTTMVASDDQALFTKRPLKGLSCASCDKQLASVSPTPTGQFQQWKKLPERNPMDRMPRSGQGFSKILNSLRTPREIAVEEEVQFQEVSQRDSLFNQPSTSRLGNKESKSTRSYVLLPTMSQTQQIKIETQLPKLASSRKVLISPTKDQ
ncbi:hypothetical protein FGO68_gene2906 [Halteria grandinella]|uniref:Uncharacterized protein n=1 Tax=Halteria grandinella TaxID=5974 RepID=A0A8J8NFL6_HALGN|nr:hypothetical protein FGO68_gene2906 [Halteria grandinella]